MLLIVLSVTPSVFAQEKATLQMVFDLLPEDNASIDAKTTVKLCSEFLTNRAKQSTVLLTKALSARFLAYVELRNYEAGKSDLDDLQRLEPKNPKYRYYRITILRDLARLEEAMQEAKEIIRLEPKFAPGYLGLATVYMEINSLENALENLSKAIALDPKYSYAYFLRGQIYAHYKVGMPDKCLADMNRLLELAPYSRIANVEMPYYLRGDSLANLNRPSEAISNFLMARRLNPNSLSVAKGLAEIYADLKKFHLAVHYAEECVRCDPNSPTGYGLCGQYYAKLGKAKEALKAIDKLLSFSAADSTILACAGKVYFELGKYKEAREFFEKGLTRHPDHFWCMMDKASMLATCPDAKYRDGSQACALAAKVYGRKSLKQWAKWAPAMILAEAHAESGDFKEAVRFAKEALEIAGPDFGRRDEFLEKLSLFEKKMPYRAKVVERID
jgi:tetratricopeptide (TPR) repeat protein